MIVDNYLTRKYEPLSWEKTYIKRDFWEEDVDYCNQFPDNLDIFSKIQEKTELFTDAFLSKKNFNSSENNQEYFLNEIRTCYEKIVIERKLCDKYLGTFPKFEITKDEEDAFVLSMANQHFRIFITIEKEIKESFYGFIYENQGLFSSQTNRLTKENCYTVFQNITDILLSYV